MYFVLDFKGNPLDLTIIYPQNNKDSMFVFGSLDGAIQFRERLIKKGINCNIVETKEIVPYRELGM